MVNGTLQITLALITAARQYNRWRVQRRDGHTWFQKTLTDHQEVELLHNFNRSVEALAEGDT